MPIFTPLKIKIMQILPQQRSPQKRWMTANYVKGRLSIPASVGRVKLNLDILVKQGFAVTRKKSFGDRSSAIYAETTKGRSALLAYWDKK